MTISAAISTPQPTRVLIVEDEPNQAYLLRLAIRKMPGLTVETAASAEYALQLFAQQPYDLLITDYRLNGMNGLELAARIREFARQTAIIILTAFADPNLRARAEQISVFQVLDKPADLAEIRQVVLGAIGSVICPATGLAQATHGGQSAIFPSK